MMTVPGNTVINAQSMEKTEISRSTRNAWKNCRKPVNATPAVNVSFLRIRILSAAAASENAPVHRKEKKERKEKERKEKEEKEEKEGEKVMEEEKKEEVPEAAETKPVVLEEKEEDVLPPKTETIRKRVKRANCE